MIFHTIDHVLDLAMRGACCLPLVSCPAIYCAQMIESYRTSRRLNNRMVRPY